MKTFDVYAMYADGSYLVASGNDQDHTEDFAERTMRQLPSYPMAVATLTRGEHHLRGPVGTLSDLQRRG